MAFHPQKFPYDVRAAFEMGALAWPLAVQRSIAAGIYDVNALTNLVFYMHHPERTKYEPIKSSETKLASEWKAFRVLVKPLVEFRDAKPSAPSSSAAKAADEPPAELPREEQIAQVLAELEQLRLDGKLTERQYSWASGAARSVLTKTGPAVSYINLAVRLGELATVLPSMPAVAGTVSYGAAVGVLALAAPFLQFVGFIYLLSDSLDTDIRIYRSVAAAYGITAWVFDEATPTKSALIRDRLTTPPLYGKAREGSLLDSEWREAAKEARSRMAELARKGDTTKETMRLVLQVDGTKKLARAVIQSIAAKLPASRHEEENSLRLIAGEISYAG